MADCTILYAGRHELGGFLCASQAYRLALWRQSSTWCKASIVILMLLTHATKPCALSSRRMLPKLCCMHWRPLITWTSMTFSCAQLTRSTRMAVFAQISAMFCMVAAVSHRVPVNNVEPVYERRMKGMYNFGIHHHQRTDLAVCAVY